MKFLYFSFYTLRRHNQHDQPLDYNVYILLFFIIISLSFIFIRVVMEFYRKLYVCIGILRKIVIMMGSHLGKNMNLRYRDFCRDGHDHRDGISHFNRRISIKCICFLFIYRLGNSTD